MPIDKELLRRARVRKGLTHWQLYQICGIRKNRLIQLEKGNIAIKTELSQIEELSKALEVSPDHLLGIKKFYDSTDPAWIDKILVEKESYFDIYTFPQIPSREPLYCKAYLKDNKETILFQGTYRETSKRKGDYPKRIGQIPLDTGKFEDSKDYSGIDDTERQQAYRHLKRAIDGQPNMIVKFNNP